jgi:hypothetical protein
MTKLPMILPKILSYDNVDWANIKPTFAFLHEHIRGLLL